MNYFNKVVDCKYFWISLVFIIFIFLNKSFPAEVIKSEDCLNDQCISGDEHFVEDGNAVIEQLDNNAKFDQLKNSGILFGQIFKAEGDSISGVELDFDVIKQHNNGGKKYTFSLKKVSEKNGEFKIKNGSLAKLEFQVNDLARYRQQDGKYFFPMETDILKLGEYYFVGFDNSKMQVDRFNHLSMKGSKVDTYRNGFTAMREEKETKIIGGDLYFRIFRKVNVEN